MVDFSTYPKVDGFVLRESLWFPRACLNGFFGLNTDKHSLTKSLHFLLGGHYHPLAELHMDLDTMDFILRYMTPQPEDYRPLLDPLAAPGRLAARRASAPPDFYAVGTALVHERAASAAGMAEETTTTGGGGIGGGDDLLGSRGQETGEAAAPAAAAEGQEQTSRGVLLSSFEKQLGEWFASTELQPAPPPPQDVDEPAAQGMSHPRPRAEVGPRAEEALENRGNPPGGDEQPHMSHPRPQRIRIRPELQARVDKAVEKWGDLYGRAGEWDNNVVRRVPKPSRSVRRRRDGEAGACRASDTGPQRTPSQAGGVVAPGHGGHSGDEQRRRVCDGGGDGV